MIGPHLLDDRVVVVVVGEWRGLFFLFTKYRGISQLSWSGRKTNTEDEVNFHDLEGRREKKKEKKSQKTWCAYIIFQN